MAAVIAVSTAFLYDHFTPFVLVQLKELGFCGKGEAKDFATVENRRREVPVPDAGTLTLGPCGDGVEASEVTA